MIVEMLDPQGWALAEIADRKMTRDDVAITYAFCIRQQQTDRIAEINRAIVDRWSISALGYIKRKAWKRIGS
jgi:hypothetical protein